MNQHSGIVVDPVSASTYSANLSPIWLHRHSVLLWVVYFCYAVTAALLLQKLVLPMLPSLHAGHGLLNNDAILFHQEALALAEKIRQQGWGVWSLWPGGGGSGNVAILAVLYTLFGPDPALLVPINAALHALGGFLVFLIGRRLWPGGVGIYGGLVASALFVLFPSALVWYGQIHKDSFSIAGVLLIVYAFLRIMYGGEKDVWVAVACALAGIALIAVVRPYYFKFLANAGMVMLLVVALFTLSGRQPRRSLWGASGILGLLVLAAMFIRSGSGSLNDTGSASLNGTIYGRSLQLTAGQVWNQSDFIPRFLDSQAELAARTRYGLTRYNQSIGARTLIDGDVVLQSFGDVTRYAPRAMQVALFAPFPSVWLQKTSLPIMLGIGETLVWYLFVPGILIALYRRRSVEVAVTMVFALAFLTMIGVVEPNVGTIFRMRYAHLNLLLLVGALGWVSLWSERSHSAEKAHGMY